MPGPGQYNLSTEFEINKVKNVGKSIGIAYRAYEKVYNEGLIHEQAGWTEPGCYNIDGLADTINKSNKKHTFRGRESLGADSHKLLQPGPGHYEDHTSEGTNAIGRYFNSTHKNSLASNFSKGDRHNFITKPPSKTPGPGTYDDGLEIAKARNGLNNF